MGKVGVSALAAAKHIEDVTPSGADSTVSPAAVLFVGGAGDVKVDAEESGTITFTLPAGSILPVSVKKVYDTGTSATNIIALR